MTRLVYTSSHDHMFIINKLGEPVAVIGKQIVVLHYLMEQTINETYVAMSRGEFREFLDEFFKKVKADTNHVIYEFANRLTIKNDTLFNGRGEFSNSIKSLVDRKLIEERKVDNKANNYLYHYNVLKFTIRDYILFDSNNTYRNSGKKNKERVKAYNKKYHDANKEELNRKKRLKYAISKIKLIENHKKVVDKHVDKVAKLRELARIKEEAHRLRLIKQKEKEELRLAREAKRIAKKETSKKETSKKADIIKNIDPANIITSSKANINEKPVIMSSSSTTTRNNIYYTPYQVSNKHKTKEVFIHGGQRAVSPNAKTPPPKREIKSRYVTKDMRKKGNVYNISPFELEGMIKDFISKGNKIKVYDQVSEDLKAIIQGPDRKTILSK